MDQGINARKSTRFAAPSNALKKDWHSLGATELFIMEHGEWKSDDLLKSVAMLSRIAPNWQRTLRWPSPLHLARAIVRDHPHAYFEEEEEE
ncbi:RNaseH domain-containing protein [Desulfonatronovibrio magnus]|uniref:RNaseH domain-containing protein n=1 Tax=Desulfonatronovibrio magnus TaxID=698827 RepID=UPI0005EB109A|nr:RNaseH domain-containing protein [Desulfonatronovibrio magnus]